MIAFKELEPLGPTACTGDVARSAQLSDTVWVRRFAADLGDGRWDVCDVSTFVVDANDGEDGLPVRPMVELRVAHTLCTDPADHLGTELDTSDVLSRPIFGRDASDETAQEYCDAWNADDLPPSQWAAPDVRPRPSTLSPEDVKIVEAALGDAWAYRIGDAEFVEQTEATDRLRLAQYQALAERLGLTID